VSSKSVSHPHSDHHSDHSQHSDPSDGGCHDEGCHHETKEEAMNCVSRYKSEAMCRMTCKIKESKLGLP